MTAEVAIMNKQALIFAADSATTVTSWASGKKETRFFKGANKLFQLSDSHPIGLMINGSANLQGVPWEIIVKEFRAQLGNEHCDKLDSYCDKFFNFIRGHKGLFPDAFREAALKRNLIRSALAVVADVAEEMKLAEAQIPPLEAYRAVIEASVEEVRKLVPKAPITEAEVESAVAAHLASTTEELSTDRPSIQSGISRSRIFLPSLRFDH